ncbi:MAG: chorismate synthase [Anaerolineae bacterium]|nr:chorismate synthase [Anaerolineae bacterium]MDW8067685.1 chorismate synthase [Anaerolineae bacterium]
MSALRLLTAGESHGPQLTVILEGMIAGVPVPTDALNRELARRQISFGAGGRMRIERDQARITAGVMAGRTTGAPIALEIANLDYSAWADREIAPMTIPRPGHADLTAAVKYGYRDLRLGLERASARETAARVAAGAICKLYLAQFGIVVGSYVTAIGEVEAILSEDLPYPERLERAEHNDLRCPDPAATEAMRQHIQQMAEQGDTVGGVFEVVALGVPPGLGSHVHFDRRLSGRLLGALGSIPAVKGVEIGPAFANARLPGTQVHDPIVRDPDGTLRRRSNRAGGLEGGITTGEPIVLRAAMKPISTTRTPLPSVDLSTGNPTTSRYERSDVCAVPRAAVVGEAMVAWVLADELIRKLGGDSLEEQLPRFAALRRSHLADLPMDNTPWRFGYPGDTS